MKSVTTIILAVAAALLILPALLLGSYGYALAVAVVSAAGVVLLRTSPQSKWSDLLLIAVSVMTTFSLFLGIHPLFAIVAVTLFIYAWNAGHRFGHFDRSPVEATAKQRFILQTLAFSLAPSLAVALVLSAFLYVRFPLPFGTGIGLSAAVFLVIALFTGLARAARQGED
ncbi:MAG: hypothetical protein V3T03_05240 [Candidatus Bipolaricaulota bacterium]